MYIYAKRIDHKNLCIVQQNYNKCRVLLLNGKRFDFPDYKAASRKVWHITNSALGVESYSWTAWMAKSELEARINARLDRALAKAAAESSQEDEADDDRGERNMLARQYYRNMANELASEPEFLDNSEEDQDTDFHDDDDDSGDDVRGW